MLIIIIGVDLFISLFVSIGSSNEVIDITTDTVAESPSIVCDFLTVLIGAAQCEVCYSVDPLCREPTCLSMQAGAGGVAVIDLPSLESGVQYCYIVTAVIGGVTAAKVEGTFSTGNSRLSKGTVCSQTCRL